MIQIEIIGIPTDRAITYERQKNEDELRVNLSLMENRRAQAIIREAWHKQDMTRYYNKKKIKNTHFRVWDFGTNKEQV